MRAGFGFASPPYSDPRDEAMRRVLSLTVVFLATTLAFAQVVSEDEKKEGFRPLFDGKTFEGWVTNDKVLKIWKVEDGMLKLNGSGGHLFTKCEPTTHR